MSKPIAILILFGSLVFSDFARADYRDAPIALFRPFNVDAPYLPDGDLLDYPGGFVSTNIELQDDVARALVLQTDGKLVVAGRAYDGTYNFFAITRYWPDGSLDTSFDTDGKTITVVGSGFGWAHSVMMDTAGRIVAAGRAYTGVSYDFAVVRYLTNGALDTTFSGDGIQYINPSGNADFARGMAIQTDGKLLIGGYGGTSGGYNLAVARLNTDGSLDATFHTDGMAVTDVNPLGDDLGHALSLSTTGKIYLSGSTNNGVNEDFVLVRYTSTGTLDTAFHTDGIAVLDVGGNDDTVYAMILQPDDKPIIAGRANNGSDWQLALVRYATTGSIDATFNGGTAQTLNVGAGADWIHGLALDTSGRILASGRANISNLDFMLARFTSAGLLDTTFHTTGYATVALGTGVDESNALLYHQEKIYSAGRSEFSGYDTLTVVRYNSDGNPAASGDLDANFNVNGYRTTAIAGVDWLRAMKIDSQGRIVAVGHSEVGGVGSEDVVVMRYLSNGVLDTAFHTDGIVTTDVRGDADEGLGVAFQTDGKIIVSGYSENGGAGTADFLLLRYNTNGTLDTSFHTDGIAIQNIDNDREFAYGVIVQTDGKIVSGGWTQTSNATSRDFALMRHLTTGVLDTTFHTDGIVRYDFGAEEDQGLSTLVLQADGKILLGGFAQLGAANADRDMAVLRILTNGNVDTTFDTDGRVTVDMGGTRAEGRAIALQSDGKILLAGFHRSGGANSENFAIARINSNGSLDTTFGTGGATEHSVGTQDQPACVKQTQNGKIIMVGFSANDIGIVRLTTTGAIDTGFDTDGVRAISIGGTDVAYDCALGSDERIYFVGTVDDDHVAGRLWP